MKLSNISRDLIFENVEKLLPYLRQELTKYPYFSKMVELYKEKPQIIDAALMEILSLDPKFYEDHVLKNKKLEHCKAPFAKDLIRLLSNVKTSYFGQDYLKNIIDKDEIRGLLKAYNNSKRMGGNIDLSKINTLEELSDAVQDYHTGEAKPADAQVYGFEKVFEDDRFAVFKIDSYVDSSESPIPEIKELAETDGQNAHVHALFTKTGWCVRHKNTFYGRTPIYYLVYSKSGIRWSKSFLIHFKSGEWKDPNNGALGNPTRPSAKPEEAKRFVIAMLENQKTNAFSKEVVDSILNAKVDFSGISKYPDLMDLAFRKYDTVIPGYLSQKNLPNFTRDELIKFTSSNISYKDLKNLLVQYYEVFTDKEVDDLLNKLGDLLIANHTDFLDFISVRSPLLEKFLNWNQFQNWEKKLEQAIVTKHGYPKRTVVYYTTNIRKKRWPEIEQVLISSPKDYDRYTNFFNIQDVGESPASQAFKLAVAKMNLTGDIDDEDIEPLLQDLNLAVRFALQYIGSGWVELESELAKPENAELQKEYKRALNIP